MDGQPDSTSISLRVLVAPGSDGPRRAASSDRKPAWTLSPCTSQSHQRTCLSDTVRGLPICFEAESVPGPPLQPFLSPLQMFMSSATDVEFKKTGLDGHSSGETLFANLREPTTRSQVHHIRPRMGTSRNVAPARSATLARRSRWCLLKSRTTILPRNLSVPSLAEVANPGARPNPGGPRLDGGHADPAQDDERLPGALAQLADPSERAHAYAGKSKSEATIRAYAAGWRDFLSFCEQRDADPLPASDATVAAYLAYLADRHAKGGDHRPSVSGHLAGTQSRRPALADHVFAGQSHPRRYPAHARHRSERQSASGRH